MSPELLEALSSVLMLLGIGFAARKYSILTEEADASILKLLVNVLLPCFVFSKVVGNPTIIGSTNAFWAPLAGFLGVVVGMFICFILARYVIKIKIFEDKSARRTFAVATGLQNYGFIAIPVIERVFGDELLGIMLLHNMGVDLAIWSIGIMLLSGKVGKESLMKMVNGPSITVVVSLLINGLGVDQYVPSFVTVSVDSVGAAFIPMGIMLVGTTVYGCLYNSDAQFKHWQKDLPLYISANILRSGLLPLTIIYMAFVMPYSEELTKVIIVEAAMPAAFFPIVLAKYYNGRPEVAMKISLSSLVIGFAILPFWISLGRSVLGV